MTMDHLEERRLRSEVETLRVLLEAHEATAVEQAEIAEQALASALESARALEQQARQRNEVLEASSECVMVIGGDWVVQYMNSQAREIMGTHELVGRHLQEAYPGGVETPFFDKYREVMKTREPLSFEDFHTLRDCWFAVNVAPVGEGIAIFFRDVTQRRRNDAMLQRTEKLAAVGRLASSISHEINNPLESVVNLLYLIERSDSAGDDMRTYAALAASELQRISHIVTHTLKFHRQSTRAAACRFSEVLESVLSLYQGRMATQKIEVIREYTEEDVIVCFAGDMRQVFANLIGNALDALRGKGKLVLRTRRSHHAKTGARGLRVVVADTGCGMSEETRRRIFEAFFTTKLATGTGLGLWVSDEIIRNHKGTVQVKSSEQKGKSGTVFSLFFPVDEVEQRTI